MSHSQRARSRKLQSHVAIESEFVEKRENIEGGHSIKTPPMRMESRLPAQNCERLDLDAMPLDVGWGKAIFQRALILIL